MRRYTVRINDADHVLDVEELAAGAFAVQLEDGRLLDVVLADHRDLAQAVITPQVEVGSAPAPGARAAVVVGRRAVPGPPAVSGGSSVPRPAAARGGGGGQRVTAPMPGVILDIEVAAGAVVGKGQTLMVLEAMKMKNELKAERDGTVAAVLVHTGDQVKHGDLLLEFEG
jgi:biotin carboxyl carrier protein